MFRNGRPIPGGGISKSNELAEGDDAATAYFAGQEMHF
jgi:hypothetical protein